MSRESMARSPILFHPPSVGETTAHLCLCMARAQAKMEALEQEKQQLEEHMAKTRSLMLAMQVRRAWAARHAGQGMCVCVCAPVSLCPCVCVCPRVPGCMCACVRVPWRAVHPCICPRAHVCV